jgi:hypothetical protein
MMSWKLKLWLGGSGSCFLRDPVLPQRLAVMVLLFNVCRAYPVNRHLVQKLLETVHAAGKEPRIMAVGLLCPIYKQGAKT